MNNVTDEQQQTIRQFYLKHGFSTSLQNQNFEKIESGNEKFEDNLFPPTNESIYNNTNMLINNQKPKPKTDELKHPKVMFF